MSAEPGRLFGRRVAAGTVDWIVALGLPFFGLGTLAPDLWVSATAGAILAYFTLFRALGWTPGLRLARLRVRDSLTGRPPGPIRSFVRANAGLAGAGAFLLLFAFAFGDPPAAGYSAADVALLAGTTLVAAGALVGDFWQAFDRRGLSWLDHLLRLETVPAGR